MSALNVSELLDRPRVGAHRLLIYALSALVMLLNGYDATVLAYVLPGVAHALGVKPHAVTSVFVLQFMAFALGSCIISPVADRFGRRWTIIVCTALFGIFTLGVLGVESVAQLAVLRCLGALFYGGVTANAVAMTAEYTPHRKRPLYVMLLFIAWTVGTGGGGFFAALLLARFGWQSAFWVGGLVPLILVPVLFFFMPESIEFLVVKGRFKETTAALHRIAPELALGDATTYTIDNDARKRGVPVIDLFRDGRGAMTVLIWIVFGANLFILTAVGAWQTTYFNVLGGFPQVRSAQLAALWSVGGILSPFVLAPLIRRYGSPRVIAVDCLLGAAFLLALGFVIGADLAGIVISIAGFFIIGCSGAIMALAAEAYPIEIRATGLGWTLGIGRFGASFGPALGGFMLARQWSSETIYVVFAMISLVSAIAAIGIRCPQPAAAPTPLKAQTAEA